MPNPVAHQFAVECENIRQRLRSLPKSVSNRPWRPDGWTGRAIVGHMIDSAANNHQRFVRAAIDGSYTGPTYKQQEWVDMHGYLHQPWTRLLNWWETYHQILTAVVSVITEEQLLAPCKVGDDPQVTLEFLITDYLDHQRHHLRQLILISETTPED